MARIAGVNIPQNKIVQVGLTYIHGIGDKFSKQICKDLEIPKAKRVNELTDDQILKIREYIDKNYTVEGDFAKRKFFKYKKINRSCLLQRIKTQKKTSCAWSKN